MAGPTPHIPAAGRPDKRFREPLWDRIDSNRIRLAIYVGVFVLATVLVVDGFAAVFGGILLLVATGAIAQMNGVPFVLTGERMLMLLIISSIVAVGASLTWSFFALRRSEKWLLKRVEAALVPKGELVDVKMALKDMALAGGLQFAPALYLIDNTTTNAAVFAAARRRAVVVITKGFVTKLTLEQQRAVFANLIARLVSGDTVADTGVTGLLWPLQAWREQTLVLQNEDIDQRMIGEKADRDVFAAYVFLGIPMAIIGELFAWGSRTRQRKSAEKADAEGMLLLKDPHAMLAALERCVELDNVVPGAGETLGNLFYCWTGDSTNDEDDPEWLRVARLREVLGVEGWVPPAGRETFAPEPPSITS